MAMEYANNEQPNTSFNLKEKFYPFNQSKNNNILVEINSNKFTQQDFNIIAQLSEIIQDSGEIGEFELGNIKVNIINLTTFENELIKVQ